MRKWGKKSCVFSSKSRGKKGDFLTRAPVPPQKVSRENFLSFEKLQKLGRNPLYNNMLGVVSTVFKIFSREMGGITHKMVEIKQYYIPGRYNQ